MTNTIPNVSRELLERCCKRMYDMMQGDLHEELRALLSAPSPAGVDGLEVVRKACEVANCKYPDMEAMADFKRDVTPSVVIGLLDGIRHAKGIAAINDARANGCAETVQFLRLELSGAQAIIDGLRARCFSLVMNCAAELETASYCMTDEEAKRIAQSGADYYRKEARLSACKKGE